jgi:hypothetical protein
MSIFNSLLFRVVICVHGENSFYRVIQDDGSDKFRLGGRYHIRQRQLEKLCHKVIPVSLLLNNQYFFSLYSETCLNQTKGGMGQQLLTANGKV